MRDRLLEILNTRQDHGQKWSCFENGQRVESVTNEILADHLLANGVVVLPCKVGDIIYRIVNGKIKKSEVEKIEITKNITAIFYDWHGMGYELSTVSDFGKTVFLTREEAEQKLKEGKG